MSNAVKCVSYEEFISLWNGFLKTSIPCEEMEDFRIVVVPYAECGGRIPLLVNTFLTILGSYSISGIDFSPITRARIFIFLRSPRIDSKDSIPPGCEAWRAGTTTLFLLDYQPPIDCLKIPAQSKNTG